MGDQPTYGADVRLSVCTSGHFPAFNLLRVVVCLWAKGSWHTPPTSNHAETLPLLAGSFSFWPRSRVRVPGHFFFLVFFFFLRVRCSSFAPTWYKRCPAVCEGILLVRLRAPAAVPLYTALFCERSHFCGRSQNVQETTGRAGTWSDGLSGVADHALSVDGWVDLVPPAESLGQDRSSGLKKSTTRDSSMILKTDCTACIVVVCQS